MSGDDGCITHARLELDGDVIMLASPTPHHQSPRRHREHCEPAREWVRCSLDCRRCHVQVSDADYHVVTPYFVVPGAAVFITFLKEAFGAQKERRPGEPGRLVAAGAGGD
jgi:uncharacterized glyoxalase superfamily protein PhnB